MVAKKGRPSKKRRDAAKRREAREKDDTAKLSNNSLPQLHPPSSVAQLLSPPKSHQKISIQSSCVPPVTIPSIKLLSTVEDLPESDKAVPFLHLSDVLPLPTLENLPADVHMSMTPPRIGSMSPPRSPSAEINDNPIAISDSPFLPASSSDAAEVAVLEPASTEQSTSMNITSIADRPITVSNSPAWSSLPLDTSEVNSTKPLWSVDSSKSIDAGNAKRDRLLRDLLLEGDKIALVIDDIQKDLTSPCYVGELGAVIRPADLMNLLPGQWLTDELVTGILGIYSADRHNVQLVAPTVIEFHRHDIDSKLLNQRTEKTMPCTVPVSLREGVDTLLIPANVAYCHWIILVARIDAKAATGTITWYNSAPAFDGSSHEMCVTVLKLLQLSGAALGSHLQGITWALEEAYSPQQRNGDDCGVFAIRTGIAAIHGEDIRTLDYNGYALRLDYALLLRYTLIASEEQQTSQIHTSQLIIRPAEKTPPAQSVIEQQDGQVDSEMFANVESANVLFAESTIQKITESETHSSLSTVVNRWKDGHSIGRGELLDDAEFTDLNLEQAHLIPVDRTDEDWRPLSWLEHHSTFRGLCRPELMVVEKERCLATVVHKEDTMKPLRLILASYMYVLLGDMALVGELFKSGHADLAELKSLPAMTVWGVSNSDHMLMYELILATRNGELPILTNAKNYAVHRLTRDGCLCEDPSHRSGYMNVMRFSLLVAGWLNMQEWEAVVFCKYTIQCTVYIC